MISEINNLKEFYRYPVTPGSYFISLEGIEGSGKSTQIKLIEESLRQKNFNVITLREPGGTKFGEKLREAILESKVPLHPLAECHLFLASRAQLLKEKVLPLLLQPGHVVILDRYMDSTLAYQGKARRLGYDVVLNLHKNDPLNLMPHRTYFLDISLETSMQRQTARGQHKDYFESENHQFYSELIQGYRDMANLFPERILKIDATKSMNEVQSIIQADLEQFLK
jgi:dTMP kinase